jgi:hypothetical protein
LEARAQLSLSPSLPIHLRKFGLVRISIKVGPAVAIKQIGGFLFRQPALAFPYKLDGR